MTTDDDFAFSAMLIDQARGSLHKRVKMIADPTVTTEKDRIRDKLEKDLAEAGIGSYTRAAIMQGEKPRNFDPDHLTHWTNKAEAVVRQVGGTHYAKLAIDPFTYAYENKLDPLQFSVVKYVTRFRDKNGIEDLNKAIDSLQRLIALERAKAAK